MSDPTIVGLVTITPTGGGWYTLTTEANPEGERIQGIENANARATEISAAGAPPEGQLPPQGELDPAAPVVIAADPAAPAPPVEDSDEVKALKAELAASRARAEELEKAAQSIATVVTTADPELQPGVVPGFIPREYVGQMDPKAKAALKKLGFGVSTIVLEENDSIPPTGLFISHNGKPYLIKPGEEVDVPDFIISVLDDAIMSTPIVSEADKKVLSYRDRSKYPYRRINTK